MFLTESNGDTDHRGAGHNEGGLGQNPDHGANPLDAEQRQNLVEELQEMLVSLMSKPSKVTELMLQKGIQTGGTKIYSDNESRLSMLSVAAAHSEFGADLKQVVDFATAGLTVPELTKIKSMLLYLEHSFWQSENKFQVLSTLLWFPQFRRKLYTDVMDSITRREVDNQLSLSADIAKFEALKLKMKKDFYLIAGHQLPPELVGPGV